MRKLREVFGSRSRKASYCEECASVLASGRCLDQHIEEAKVKALKQTGRLV